MSLVTLLRDDLAGGGGLLLADLASAAAPVPAPAPGGTGTPSRAILLDDLAGGGAILRSDLAQGALSGWQGALALVVANYVLSAGTTWPLGFAATYANDGQPATLAGAQITCLVKANRYDADTAALATLTLANGGVLLTQPALGQGVVLLPPAATAGVLSYSILSYTVRVYLNGAVYDIQTGTIAAIAGAVVATS